MIIRNEVKLICNKETVLHRLESIIKHFSCSNHPMPEITAVGSDKIPNKS